MKIAITGMIASGKSAVLGELGRLGWLIISADELAAEVARGREVREFLVKEFGGREPSRDELRARFLADEGFRKAWEGVIHPLVRVRLDGILTETPHANVAVEIPLLFEKKLESGFEKIVVCKSSPELALQRGEARGLPKEDYLALSKLLIPLETKESFAYFIITNDGDLPALIAQVHALHQKLLS